MKDSVKKCLSIEIILGIASILNFFLPDLFDHDKQIFFLIFSLILVFIVFGFNIKRNANDKGIIRNILIYLFIYYIGIYLLGLYIGFARTIYSLTLSNLINNILPTFATIALVEVIRHEMIEKTNKDKIIVITSCILFILFEASYRFNAYNYEIKDDIYKYVGLVVLASITKNILMTILNTKTDALPGIVYRVIMEELIYVVFIVPNLGPYLESVALIVLPVLISIMIINTTKKSKTIDKPKDTKKKSKLYILVVSILLVLVALNAGIFKYQLLVIGSNSMQKYMSKGDVILLEKLKGKELDQLKKGDILVFKYDNKIISHRIYKIVERDNAKYYITKGDNNDQADAGARDEASIIGIVRMRFEKIGLPSIWINELFD